MSKPDYTAKNATRPKSSPILQRLQERAAATPTGQDPRATVLATLAATSELLNAPGSKMAEVKAAFEVHTAALGALAKLDAATPAEDRMTLSPAAWRAWRALQSIGLKDGAVDPETALCVAGDWYTELGAVDVKYHTAPFFLRRMEKLHKIVRDLSDSLGDERSIEDIVNAG